ncbi:hypothetical protein ANCCAN_14878 [Ancylostoma caninum]|uniref:Uncharacterized protein n=1 Tax=Ancylostoma caninum TaxID=29170 RepID=A0A368G429_ANCCA|nr:hypothetical protein ANCCAN_14878 [Ancylostoma caninum]
MTRQVLKKTMKRKMMTRRTTRRIRTIRKMMIRRMKKRRRRRKRERKLISNRNRSRETRKRSGLLKGKKYEIKEIIRLSMMLKVIGILRKTRRIRRMTLKIRRKKT